MEVTNSFPAPVEGNPFESENTVVNPVAAVVTQQPAAETAAQATEPNTDAPSIFAINPRPRDSETGKVIDKYNTLNYAAPGAAQEVLAMLCRPDVVKLREALRQHFSEQGKLWGLPYACPHYSGFRNDHRAQEDIIPELFTYDTCVDMDDPEKAPLAVERALALNKDELSEWQDNILYIDYSTRKPKAHIWIRMPIGKTIEESQLMFCSDLGSDLGVEPDPQCFTPERLILMTGDTIYMSDRWLKPLSSEEIDERREAFLMRGLDVDGRPLKKPETTPAASAETQPQVCQSSTATVALTPRLRYIFDQFVRLTGQPESNFRTENFRHNMVKAVLSVGADRVLCEAEFRVCLLEKMGAYSQDKDISRLVTDFYSKYNEPAQRFTRDQLRIMADAQRKFPQADANHTSLGEKGISLVSTPVADSGALLAPVYGDTAPLDEIYASPKPPQLSTKARPAFVKAATAPVPKDGKETAAQAMFPPLGMYCDASFVYDDGTPREPRGNCLIIAGTGGGKDNTTKFMLKHLEMPREQKDAPNRKILNDWKAVCKRMEGKNEDKPPRPANVAVRSVASDITKARLSELMADSEGRIIHTRMIEFDQWFGVEGWKPGPNCPFTNLKLTDDEDNPFGQERVGKDSITYRGPLSINWNSSTTISKALYYFRNCMTDGPISRLTLATAPIRGLGAPMPKHGKYDEKYDASLKPFIDNLCKTKGLITCKPAIRLVQRLKKELDDYSIKSGDEVFDNLGHRALVAAFRKACLLYAANGLRWERSIEGFCRWSLHYDLFLKLSIFGDAIRSADGEVKTSHRGPRNLLAQLNEVFTRKELVIVRIANGMKEEGTDNMLSQWKHRGYIEELPDGKYRKIITNDK